MCDTMGAVIGSRHALFAKNSDRSPNEPQVLEFFPARHHDDETVRATYLEIDQVPHTYACVLSRPVWMWGAEMGVNEHGVCIGNEAVFTKGKYNKEASLTGMDLLRLGLERGSSAKEALEVIIELLERYGQGGDCGYDSRFFYDNSFLIMDATSLYILETAGSDWVWKQTESGSISNRLSISTEGDQYSSGTAYHFASRHKDPIYTYFSGSASRLAHTKSCLTHPASVLQMMKGLRTHDTVHPPLTKPSLQSPCMHAGGLVGDQTTASMIVELVDDAIIIWATGSSTPCISLFKPWLFGTDTTPPVFEAGDDRSLKYWLAHERFHRKSIGKELPGLFYSERNALESAWLETVKVRLTEENRAEAFSDLSLQAARQDGEFFTWWNGRVTEGQVGTRRFLKYWDWKTKKLDRLAKPARWT